LSNDLFGALQASNSARPSEKGMIHHLAEFIIVGDNFPVAVKKKDIASRFVGQMKPGADSDFGFHRYHDIRIV
jgi:hypothetical protein